MIMELEVGPWTRRDKEDVQLISSLLPNAIYIKRTTSGSLIAGIYSLKPGPTYEWLTCDEKDPWHTCMDYHIDEVNINPLLVKGLGEGRIIQMQEVFSYEE